MSGGSGTAMGGPDRSRHGGLPRREARGRREAGSPSALASLEDTLGVRGAGGPGEVLPLRPGSFSVPRSPYRLCLRSSPPRPSLSAWKPCSATSGSCSILPGPRSGPRLAGVLVQGRVGLLSGWAGEMSTQQPRATAPGPPFTWPLHAPGVVPAQPESSQVLEGLQ